MPITADHIRTTVDAYLNARPAEKERLARITTLLDDPAADITSRKEFRGTLRRERSWPIPRGESSTSNTWPLGAGCCPADTLNRATPLSSPRHCAS
ncbi:hypothetical protein ACFQ3Z_17475 [Streptomyces nogalater]